MSESIGKVGDKREIYVLLDQIAENLSRMQCSNERLESANMRISRPPEMEEDSSERNEKSISPETIMEKLSLIRTYSNEVAHRYESAVSALNGFV